MKNRVLARQLEKSGLSYGAVPASLGAWRELLRRVERAYEENDQNYYLLERSLEISSKEMQAQWNELKQFEQQWRSLGECLPDTVMLVDVSGRIVFSNRALAGAPPEHLIGRELYPLFGTETENRDAVRKCVEAAAQRNAPESIEIESRNGAGQARLFSIRVSPVAKDEKVTQLILVQTDITEMRRVQVEILARKKAEALAEVKSRFLANMSHEIRTPLTAILGLSEILASQASTAAQRASGAQIIRRNGQLLLNIINDILDLSKVEAGKIDIKKTDVPIQEIVQDVRSLLDLRAEEKGIRLSICSSCEVPSVVHTDPLRLRQILLNVVGNAIKFTERGSVDVCVKALPGGGARKLAFSVRDTGIGVRPEQVNRLFAPFSQADPSTTRKAGGTGLGLILSKKLANLLGGDVSLEKSSPQGSTFLVTIDPGTPEAIPALAPPPRRQPRPGAASEAGKRVPRAAPARVLVVDDSDDNRLIAAFFLEESGATVETAGSGKEGIAKAMAGSFDLVLLDLQMPEMDGFETVRELRRLGYRRPVVALSAYAMEEDRRRCLASGFDGHLSKPIDRKALLAAVSDFSLQGTEQAGRTAHQAPEEGPSASLEGAKSNSNVP